MRFACLFIVLFAVLFAHAQEVDTTSASLTNSTQVVEDNNIARIRYQYERAIKVGDRQKSLGTGLVIGGGVGITAGIAITVYAIKLINDNDHKKQKGDCGSADGGPMFVMFMGTGTMVVGGAAIAGALALPAIIGGAAVVSAGLGGAALGNKIEEKIDASKKD